MTLLGGFSAAVDGAPIPDKAWRLKKARELVKLLALAPRHRLHREQVMDVLWRDRAPDAAANNLHQAVYVARRALVSGAIEVRDETLRLVADVDVDRLELAAADARRLGTAAAYRAALSLYEGQLLPENRYEDWAEVRRGELAELAADLADELAALDCTDGDRPLSLPADASTFIGRGRELAELKVLLADTRLLTLAGTGGVGKTRLALELARAAEPSYASGAALVELAAITDPELVPDAVAAALDVRALSGQKLVDALIEFVSGPRLLLVLDNCEHVLAGATELVDVLLRSADTLTVVATSREPLHVPGEVVFRVPSLGIPDPELVHEPGQIVRYEAVRLFVERAGAASPGFVLDELNATDVARICFRLDGLPLALELAAARTAALGPTAVAERLDDRFRLLRSASHASPTRQQTLTATLQWSHDLLERDEQILFRRLAVFADGFELKAVESVCAGGPLDPEHIADLLARLVEKSLVATDEFSSRERRYRLLETVRLYAGERLEVSGERSASADRQAGWALALAEEHRDSPRLDRDAANLRAGFDTRLDRAPADSLRFCIALLPFWMRRIDLQLARRRLDQALAAARDRTVLRAQALLAAAAICMRSGTLARGLAYAKESYEVASEIGDARAQWRALQYLGEFGLASDEADVATPWLERALELARAESLAAAEATCIYTLGVVQWMLGDLVRAEELVARSSDLFAALAGSSDRIPSPVNFAETSRSGVRPGLRVVFEDTLQPYVEISCDAAVGYVLTNQAGIVRARGDLGRARALLEDSAARFAASGDERGTAVVLVRRAYLEFEEGALGAARRDLEAALELRQRQGDRRGVGLVLAGLALVDTTAGDYRRAELEVAAARDTFRRAGDRWGLASALWRTADLAFARDRLDDAEAALREAREVLVPTQRNRWIANTLAGLAEIAVLRGDLERATALLAEARHRYAGRHDALGVEAVERRLLDLAPAKEALSQVKEPLPTTPRPSQNERKTG